MRAEFVPGNMPSTLLGLSPEFAPSFRPGAHSVGGSLFASFRLAKADQVYGRYDQFKGDPVSAKNVRGQLCVLPPYRREFQTRRGLPVQPPGFVQRRLA